MITTTDKIVSASTIYDRHKKLMERASKFLELSEEAYKRFLNHCVNAEAEKMALESKRGWTYQNPFASYKNLEKYIHQSVISEMAAKRCMKVYRKALFAMITERKF